MKLLSWNIRGAGKRRSKDHLWHLLHSHNITIVILLEMHLTDTESASFLIWMGSSWRGVYQAGSTRAGGILVAWKIARLQCELLHKDRQVIHLGVHLSGKIRGVLSAVYASTNATVRSQVWDSLRGIDFAAFPWLILGDFNCILSQQDKRGGLPFQATDSTQSLQRLLSSAGLVDMGYMGSRFTWSNNRKGPAKILSRLDRVYANHKWFHANTTTQVKHLQRVFFDHCPLLVEVAQQAKPRVHAFVFEHNWLGNSEVTELIQQVWSPQSIAVSQMEGLSYKLSILRAKLLNWKKHQTLHPDKELQDTLGEIATLEQLGDFSEAHEMKLRSLSNKVAALNRQIYLKWWSKSKVKWIEQGDRNTALFHSFTKIRRQHNRINEL